MHAYSGSFAVFARTISEGMEPSPGTGRRPRRAA